MVVYFYKLKDPGPPLFIRDQLVGNVVSWHHHFSHLGTGGKPEHGYLKSTSKVIFSGGLKGSLWLRKYWYCFSSQSGITAVHVRWRDSWNRVFHKTSWLWLLFSFPLWHTPNHETRHQTHALTCFFFYVSLLARDLWLCGVRPPTHSLYLVAARLMNPDA